MDLKGIVMSEKSQSQKFTYSRIPFMQRSVAKVVTDIENRLVLQGFREGKQRTEML